MSSNLRLSLEGFLKRLHFLINFQIAVFNLSGCQSHFSIFQEIRMWCWTGSLSEESSCMVRVSIDLQESRTSLLYLFTIQWNNMPMPHVLLQARVHSVHAFLLTKVSRVVLHVITKCHGNRPLMANAGPAPSCYYHLYMRSVHYSDPHLLHQLNAKNTGNTEWKPNYTFREIC